MKGHAKGTAAGARGETSGDFPPLDPRSLFPGSIMCHNEGVKSPFKDFNSGRANFFLLAFIALVLGGGVLKLTTSIVLPFTIALLLAFVMYPMVLFLEKLHIPRIMSIILSVIIIIGGLSIFGAALFSSFKTILATYPKYEDRLTEIYLSLAEFFDLSYDDRLSFFENLWAQLGVRSQVRIITLSLSNSFIVFLKDALMVSLFVVFLLVEASYFKEKVNLAFENQRSGQIQKISVDVIRQVSRYLSIKFVISLVTGIVVAVGLNLVGLEFAMVWGVIQFILNFIPSIGSITAGVGAALFALLQFWPDPAPIILVAFIMLGTNMIIGNVLEPKIMGDNLGLSPIAVLLSLVAWGWLWGFAGMIMAVPMTVIIRIICENLPFLEPVSVILGSRRALLRKQNEELLSAARGENI
jgi:predicted PurR-regulated permease PerM